jgi:hypothetical protein
MESLSASDLGGAGVDVASIVDVAMAGGATMEAAESFLDAEDSEVGTVAVTLEEPDVVSVAEDVPLVDVPTVEGGVPTVAVDEPTAEADVRTVAVDEPTAEADVRTVAVDEPTAAAEAEAVLMVVGVGRVRANPKLSRPAAFAVGRLVSRQVPTAASRTILGPYGPFSLGGHDDVLRDTVGV